MQGSPSDPITQSIRGKFRHKSQSPVYPSQLTLAGGYFLAGSLGTHDSFLSQTIAHETKKVQPVASTGFSD
jgi:hypothetical protein